MPLPLIVLIRHGETSWNAEGRYQGQTDIPLNDHGRGQAAHNGRQLAAWFVARGLNARDFAYVSSTLSRASETLTIVRRALGLEPADAFTRDPRLMEAHYGIWEGLTVPEILARDADGYARRRADPLGFAPEGGETYAQVGDRAFAALRALERPSVVVCHGGLSKVVRGRLLGLDPAETMALPVPQDRFWVIEDERVTLA